MQVIRLSPVHADEYRALMLQAYSEPDAFVAAVSEREQLPREWWKSRVSDHANPTEMVFGAFVGARLVRVAGLRYHRRKRTMHKASLFGMFVLPHSRRQGVGRALVEAVLKRAQLTPVTRVVQLTVIQSNAPARRLCESCGFVPFATEPLAVRFGERFVSMVHMWCAVGEAED